ncbi:MAG: trehalose-phosphatase [Solirubrobacteraceae bacterium]|nr:trehalose-phosphatase [Solirubrobacteraceae bacterium]
MRGILGAMPPAATLAEALAPLRADPSQSAVLLDIDGTLAPIVRHADDAHVPESTRTALIAVARMYAVVACVSGRQASVGRRIVSLGQIAYIGGHGSELLLPGGGGVEIDREVAAYTERVKRFIAQLDQSVLHHERIRVEDKQAIAALHWRGAPDEASAEEIVRGIAHDAEAAGFAIHWGKKILEIRPPVEISKGRGIKRLLRDRDLTAAVYVGDDRTDLDAFAGLRDLVEHGRLGTAVCVGVTSDETPPELREQADVLIDGPPGVRELLEALT